jgi:hypothetical protein
LSNSLSQYDNKIRCYISKTRLRGFEMLDFSFTPHKKDYPAGSSPFGVYVFIAAPVPRRGAISELLTLLCLKARGFYTHPSYLLKQVFTLQVRSRLLSGNPPAALSHQLE